MDESFVIISNSESANNSLSSVGLQNDSTSIDTSQYIAEDNVLNKESSTNEKLHDINDSYNFNLKGMMPILLEKKNSVINSAKFNTDTVIADDQIKNGNRSDVIKTLSEKKSSIINIAKSENENENLSDKLKSSRNEEQDNSTVKTSEGGYVNDSNDMSDVLRILNKKKHSIIEKVRFDSDDALTIADSVKTKQKSKQLAAVLAANEEDLNLIAAGKRHRLTNKINSIDSSDDYDYKKINVVKSEINKEFFDDNQSETQILLQTLKNSKKSFLDTIID